MACLVAQVRRGLDDLSETLVLSSGGSMDLIWASSRPIVPTYLEQWEAYQQLLKCYEEFEARVAFQIGKR